MLFLLTSTSGNVNFGFESQIYSNIPTDETNGQKALFTAVPALAGKLYEVTCLV